MSRIAPTFAALAAEGRAALMPYIMTGYPAPDLTVDLLLSLEAAGADLFELGVPFTDPLADGATIQRAAEVALAAGVRFADSLHALAAARARGLRAPVVLMGYFNPFLQYGIERLVRDAATAGADGLIIPDLPPEEADDVATACAAAGLDLVQFVTPTTPDARIAQIAARASGFLYCVSLTGVTGARTELSAGLPAFLQRVRAHTALPLVVGFGISTVEHVRQVSGMAQGAIVASALIRALEDCPHDEVLATASAFVRELRTGVTTAGVL